MALNSTIDSGWRESNLRTPVCNSSIAAGIAAIMDKKTSEFGVTNKRVLLNTGLIRRNSLEVLFSKVEGTQVEQGILG
jgi:hypothetical protein